MKLVLRFIGWLTLILVVGILLSIVSVPMFLFALFLIWYYSKKNRNEQKRKYAVVGALVSGVGAFVFAVSMLTADNSETIAQQSAQTKHTSTTKPSFDTHNVTPSENLASETQKTEKKETDTSENINKISFDSMLNETHIESYRIDEETGIIIVQAPINEVFGVESSVHGFNQEMWMTMEDYHDLFPKGVFYLGYGDINGEEFYKIGAQFDPETLQAIDFDEIINEAESIAYADRYYISGFGEINLGIPSIKEGKDLVEGDPVDELYFRETTGIKREF